MPLVLSGLGVSSVLFPPGLFGGISSGEILVVLVVVLLIFGPKQLPDLAKTIGQVLRGARKAADDIKEEIGLDELIRPGSYRRPQRPVVRPIPPPLVRTEGPASPYSAPPPAAGEGLPPPPSDASPAAGDKSPPPPSDASPAAGDKSPAPPSDASPAAGDKSPPPPSEVSRPPIEGKLHD
jgi:TatA/E family protein of Tat protein translocase